MLRQSLRCCQHSMKKDLLKRKHYGDRSQWRCSVLLFGLLCCAFFPTVGALCDVLPTGCVSDTFKTDDGKFQNITCSNLGLHEVPCTGKEASSVFRLDLSNNLITSITDQFQYYDNLRELDLSNNTIPDIRVDSFDNLTKLQRLSLSGNIFTTIDEDIFEEINSLQFLDLSSMPGLTLPRKPSSAYLIVLNISNLELLSLENKFFDNLGALIEVDISHNNISVLHDNLFKNTNLETIDLSWNLMTEANVRGSQYILSLNLSYNLISSVDNHFLDDADHLTNLDLSHNLIPKLDKDTFHDCPDLQVLNLSHNVLTTLPRDIFKDNEYLLHLNLSHNLITTIPDKVFQDIPDVEIIDLSDNSFVTLDSTLFSQLRQTNIDLSNNPFECDCAGKEVLYDILHNENTFINVDETRCTDTKGLVHTFVDYNNDTCSGNLGSKCSAPEDCMVRYSQCESNVCICSSSYFDNNGDGTAMGICQEKVDLDFQCDMDTACKDLNSECAGSPTKKCRCKVNYFDNQPIYMGGVCNLQVDLGKACTMDTMCKATNSYCNSTRQCDCTSNYYDNDTTAVIGGTCILKLDLYAACNQSYQCGPTYSECLNGLCNCSVGYYDFTKSGECLAPNEFYSCNSIDQSEVVFSTSTISSSSTICEEECFKKDERYYVLNGLVCLCGNLKVVTSTSTKCCPMVKKDCGSRRYAGYDASLASAHISSQHVPLLTAGESHLFQISASLSIITEIRINFGDSDDIFYNASSIATVGHTYLYSGQFLLSVYACVKVEDVCEVATIPVGVQVPLEFLTTYITAVSKVDVTHNLTGAYYTLPMGYNVDSYWWKTFNGTIYNDTSSCPDGDLLMNNYCYKLLTTVKTWSEANAHCNTLGGWLANITDRYTHNNLTDLLTSKSVKMAWFGLHNENINGYHEWADGTGYNYNVSYHPTTTHSGIHGCFVTTDTISWSEEACDTHHCFVCQYSRGIVRSTVQNYVNGVRNLSLTVNQSLEKLSPIDTAHNATSNFITYLMVGMPFVREGYFRFLNFKTEDLAASVDISVQVFRPECSNAHVQNGCSEVSTCSNSSCTSGVTCSDSEQPCYLSNTCKAINELCTCHSEAASAFAVKACSTNGTGPSYKQVGDTKYRLPHGGVFMARIEDIPVKPNDVIAVQHPSNVNIIKCENQTSDSNEILVYTAHSNHLTGHGETFASPSSYSAHRKSCSIQGILTQDQKVNLSSNLSYSTNVGNYSLGVTIIGGVTRHMLLQVLESVANISLVSPVVSEVNRTADSLGTIYTQWKVEYIILVAVGSGTNVKSVWNFNGNSSSVNLSDSCPSTVKNDACNGSENHFAYSAYTFDKLGITNLSFEFYNDLGTVKKSLEIRNEIPIDNMSFSLNTSALIPDTVAKYTLSKFITSVSNGTNLSYNYKINGTPVFAPVTNSTFYHNFTELGTFNVTGNVFNIHGSKEKTIQVNVKQAAEFQNCKFVNKDPSVAAVNVSIKLQVQCELNSGAEVSTIWTVSDRTNNITGGNITASSSPYTWLQSLMFTQRATGVNVTFFAMDAFNQISLSLMVNVYDAITDSALTTNTSHVLPNETVGFTAFVPSPGQFGVVEYSFDYGDSTTDTGSTGNVTHKFSAAGNFTVIVTISNGPSSHSTTSFVTVYVVVGELNVSNNSPKSVTNAAVTFTVKASTGSYLVYRFESKLFNVTQDNATFTYNFTSVGDYNVTVYAFNKVSYASVTTIAYVMNVVDLRISSFTVDGLTNVGCFGTGEKKDYEVHFIHYDISKVTFDWSFGDSVVSLNGSSIKSYEYSTASNYTVTATVKYALQGVQKSVNMVVCVQEMISSPVISLSSKVALPASGLVIKNVSVTYTTGSNVLYLWSTNATATSSVTSTTFLVSFSREGFYSISVNVSNEINFIVTTKVIQVIEVVEGLSITCDLCIEKSGFFYLVQSTSYTLTVSTTSGSGVTYAWNLGDSNTDSGSSVSHNYDKLGSFNITVTATNLVTLPVSTYVPLQVQAVISDVTLMNYGTNWSTNHFDSTKMDVNISKEASFKINVLPAGMNLEYIVEFEEGSPTKSYSSNIVSHKYATTGMKKASVTARNEIDYKKASFEFYVIKVLTELTMKENGTLLNASSTTNHIVLQNTSYQYELSSPDAVENTSKISYILKDSLGRIEASEVKNPTFNVFYRSIANYTLTGYMENSVSEKNKQFKVEVIAPLSGVYISASVTNGNITLGSNITFSGSVLVGQKYANYKYYYSVAPGNESIPTHDSSNNKVTIKPGTVGFYVVTLMVYDSVSPPVYANFSVNVMVRVEGVSINYKTEHPDAVAVGNSLNFSAIVKTGTNCSYQWVAYVGTTNTTGNAQTFLVIFRLQAVYNITLRIWNDASSETISIIIYSLYAVSTYSILVPEATYVHGLDQHALPINNNATFSSSISDPSFLNFTWSLGNIIVSTSELYQHNFTNVGIYVVKLNVSNIISYQVQSLEMIIQEPVRFSNVSSCNSSFEIDIAVTMTVKYTGTNVSFEWERDQLPHANGSSIIFTYTDPGIFNINLKAKNLVSMQQVHCYIKMFGNIDNLKLTSLPDLFIDYTMIFTVDGDYIIPAVYMWIFSDGTNETTSNPTVGHVFVTTGKHKLEVIVINDISNKTVSSEYTVERLKCVEPLLTADGNKTVRRSSEVELTTNINIFGCNNYTSIHEWKLFLNDSSISLDDNITNTPILRLLRNTLPYGSLRAVFTHSYYHTPVTNNVTIYIDVVKTPLVANIKGGTLQMIHSALDVELDASGSHDPDEDTGTKIHFQWGCSHTMSTADADNVCDAINKQNTSLAKLTGLKLNLNDAFLISLTVSATGREGDVVYQRIVVVADAVPIFYITCISCIANGHDFFVNSRGVTLESNCTTGCTSNSSYVWSIYDATTSAHVTINDSMTTTSTTSKSLVVLPEKLSENTNYTFKLEVSEKQKKGISVYAMNVSSKPSSGSCTVNPNTDLIPLDGPLNVTCTGVTDAYNLTSLNYKILIGPSAVIGTTYIAYYGSKASSSFYVVPIGDGAVSLSIYAVNDFGAENFLLSKTVSFVQPTLTAGTTKLDYMIIKMISQMKITAKKNSPSEMIQYILALLNYLNQISEDNIGTLSQRMALRDVIIRSLPIQPFMSVESIEQMSSALALITEYTDELSTSTQETILTRVETLKDMLEGIVQKGMGEIRTESLIAAVNKVLTALNVTDTSSITTSNTTVLNMFQPATDFMLSDTSGITLGNYASDDERLKALTSKAMNITSKLLLVSVFAKVAGEKEITLTLSDGSVLLARHIFAEDANASITLNGVTIKTGNVLDHVGYTGPSVFQYILVHNFNPFNYDFSNAMPVNTRTLTFAFHKTNGEHLPVSNLSESSSTVMYLFHKDVPPFNVSNGSLINSTGYEPLSKMKYSSKVLSANTLYHGNITHPKKAHVAIHIQVRPNFTQSTNSDAALNVKLYKNNEAYLASDGGQYEINVTKTHVDDPKNDHRYFTLFIPHSDVSFNDAFAIKMKSPVELYVQVGVYFSSCEYFNETQSDWDTAGCAPQDESIPSVISCKCNHYTSFGGSLFVSPDQLDFTDLTEVDFSSNPIAIITCSVILFLYIVLVIAFKRMDIMDIKRISLIPLCGKDGSFKYEVTIVTGRLPRAGTTAHVGIRLIGEYGKSVRQHVSKPGAFQRNCADTFIVAYDVNLGDLRKIHIWHDNSGTSPSWYLSHVIVNDLQTDQKYYFFGEKWLTLEDENGSIQKEIKVAGSHEMTKFTHRMKTATFNALADKHLWLSLFNRPAQSRFTRTQRVTCCATILYVFVGVNAMWYGLLKKSNTEIGFGDFGWEEIVLALVSNVMVLPISIGLVYLFKKSRPKSNFLSNVHKPQTAQTLEIENLCGNSQGGSFESHNTGAVPYDLERESTIDSVPHTALGLHRSRHVAKTHRENTDDSLKRPSVSVTHASSRSPLWNEDGIMKWPESVPTFDDGQDSRPSTCSTMASVPAIKQSIKAGGSTPGAAKKTKECDAGQLIEELDKLDMKETESQSGKSVGRRRSSTTLRRPTMHKSNWGSLEDILNSDDESVADTSASRLRKRDSTTSTVKKFNPRADPRINGNGSDWPKSRESSQSSGSAERPRGMAAALRPGYYSEMTMESRDVQIPIHKEKCTLPSWCIYIGYILCFLLSVFSIIVVILYCFKFGYSESVEWVLALILSFILSVVIIEPLKALLIAVYVVAMFKNVEQDEDEDFIDILPTFDNSNEKIKDVKFKPISGFALLQAKEEGRKIHRMKIILRQFIAYIFYLWLIMVIVYVNFRYDSYLMTKHVTQDFIAPTTSNHQNFTNITSIDEFWDWTENVYAGSLYKENITDEEHPLLLGAPRMRLIRGLTSKCEASDAAMNLGAPMLTQRTCHGEGTYSEDTKDYSEGWNESNSNYSWRYFTAGQLGSTHKIGHVATYGGGGYPHILGTTLAETDTILTYLKDKGWIDLQTRAVIFEFALYSAGSDMTSMVALLVEFPLTGGVITSYEIQSQKLLWFQEGTVDPLMVLEVILFLVIAYSVVHIALQIREHRKAFFKDIWNWYEMLTTLMALVSVGMYIGCVVEATNTFNNLLDDITGFTNFERVMYVHVGMRYLHAWLLFLLMYKVVKQLRFIKFMHVYEQTLSTAVGHLLGSGLIYVILLLVYAQVGFLMYGRIVSGFESVGHSITTLIVMIRGTFDFWPMLDHHPIFSHFYVYSYYAFAYGILMALVISILTSTYRVVKSKMYFKSTLEMQDYEMIEFMLKRFKLWAGIQKPKPAFRRVRFPGLPSISSRSSSSYSNRSSASLQSAQSLTGPQYSEVQLKCMLTRLQPTWQAVLKRMDKIVALDDEEENLVKKAENEMKELNWKCRINELERQHKELLSWKNQPESSKPPVGDAKQRQSILKRLSRKDNQDRKAPATVSGAPSRTAASTPADQSTGEKASQGRRPLSDQGARVEPSTSKGRSSSSEKSKVQSFFKSIKPSKSAWNNK